ncbi:MAG: septum formation initiator family protein [Lachnospiraceae bacterium]
MQKQGNEIVLVATFVLILLCIGVTYRIYSEQTRYEEEYLSKLSEAQEMVNAQKARKEELEQQELYMDTRQYIEDIAREKLGLVYPNEIILKQSEN